MSNDKLKIIEKCRDEIGTIDNEIFSLIKKRESLSAAIGEAKRDLLIPDRDFAREKAVFENAIALAKTLDLQVSFATDLQKLIIENSLSRQERDRIKKSDHAALSVLVIGGAGRMGQWFVQFFADSGHKITILDKAKPELPYPMRESLDASVDSYDLIVIATPIRASKAILAELETLPIKKPVIFDVSSVKAPVQKALTKLKERGLKVSSLHPMFGPSVQLLFGKHVIITSLGNKEADELAKSLFKSTSLKLIDMSIDEHDRTMAYLLSLSHLIHIVFVTALHKSDVNIGVLESLASPTFSSVLAQARKVFEENPHLYYEIQALNPHNNKPYQELSLALKNTLDAIGSQSEEDFVSLMQAGQNYLRA